MLPPPANAPATSARATTAVAASIRLFFTSNPQTLASRHPYPSTENSNPAPHRCPGTESTLDSTCQRIDPLLEGLLDLRRVETLAVADVVDRARDHDLARIECVRPAEVGERFGSAARVGVENGELQVREPAVPVSLEGPEERPPRTAGVSQARGDHAGREVGLVAQRVQPPGQVEAAKGLGRARAPA